MLPIEMTSRSPTYVTQYVHQLYNIHRRACVAKFVKRATVHRYTDLRHQSEASLVHNIVFHSP